MHTIQVSEEIMSFLNQECRLGESADDVLRRFLLSRDAGNSSQVSGKGSQTTESGAEACEFGLAAAEQLAEKLGAVPIEGDPANLFTLDGAKVLIKTRRTKRGVVSIPQNVFQRFDTLLAAIVTADPEVYDVYKLSRDQASELAYNGLNKRGTAQRRLSLAKVRKHGELHSTIRLD